MLYFVYELTDPHNHTPRYVGITINPNLRLEQHGKDEQNHAKWIWVQNLLAEALEPRMKIIEVVDKLSVAQERERFWIEQYTIQGIQLFNKHLKPKPIELAKVQAKQRLNTVPEVFTDWLRYEDVVNVYGLDCELYGFESCISPSLTWTWWQKNPYACRILFSKENRSEIWGHLAIIPMEEEIIFQLLRDEISEKDIRSEHILTFEPGKHYSCYVAAISIKPEHKHYLAKLLQSSIEFWHGGTTFRIKKLYAFAPSYTDSEHSNILWLIRKIYFAPRYDIGEHAWELRLDRYSPSPLIQKLRTLQKA